MAAQGIAYCLLPQLGRSASVALARTSLGSACCSHFAILSVLAAIESPAGGPHSIASAVSALGGRGGLRRGGGGIPCLAAVSG